MTPDRPGPNRTVGPGLNFGLEKVPIPPNHGEPDPCFRGSEDWIVSNGTESR